VIRFLNRPNYRHFTPPPASATYFRYFPSGIAERGGLFSRDYRASHGCGLADCLIAATADLHGLSLVTLNAKHFPMLHDVETPYRKTIKP
jgi:hypothetical protein